MVNSFLKKFKINRNCLKNQKFGNYIIDNPAGQT